MKKELYLVKPDLCEMTLRLENNFTEKARYLHIPEWLGLKELKADINAGAVQFKELTPLIEKKNQPRYILITASNLEQGYMAVTYLAAAFNEKNGLRDIDFDCTGCVSENCDDCLERLGDIPDSFDDEIDEWKEDPFMIPIIKDSELVYSQGDYDNPFGMGEFMGQGNQRNWKHDPYWMRCTECAVCVVSETDFGLFGSFERTDKDALMRGLRHFDGNDKVYILNIDRTMNSTEERFDDMDDEMESDIPRQRQKWNNIVLSYAADEILVDWKKEPEKDEKKEYFKVLFQSVLKDRGFSIAKNFSVERVINLILVMEQEDKCQLVENVVNYAAKDWDPDKTTILKNDFDFMDRFGRAAMNKSKNNKNYSARKKMMTELIGLDSVKEQVLNVVNVMKYNRMREKMGISDGGYHNVHMMLGAPGTAKTTVAKLMGRIMVEEELLPDDRFICVNGAELKGMYVGQTAPKVKKIFEEYDIIVIDEAYSLVSDPGTTSDSYSKEAISQLLVEIEDHATDKLVIFAGYGGKMVTEKNNKMKDFLDANPGIRSRITSTIYFDSYSEEDMVSIFLQIAKNQNYSVDPKANDIIRHYFKKRVMDDNFGNGREARSLLETAVIFVAKRLYGEKNGKYTAKDMKTIKYSDIEQAIRQVEEAELNQKIQNGRGMRVGFL